MGLKVKNNLELSKRQRTLLEEELKKRTTQSQYKERNKNVRDIKR